MPTNTMLNATIISVYPSSMLWAMWPSAGRVSM
jgi:hypothetical protein